MLCNRSANLTRSTRMSLAIATTILRTVSAALASPYLTLSNFVTPSTNLATSEPKSSSNFSIGYPVSSTVSCKSAAAKVSLDIPISAKIVATAKG